MAVLDLESSAEQGLAAAALTPINTAGEAELARLEAVGPELAAAIVAYRQRRGPFRGPVDLAAVPGVGRSQAFRLAPLFTWQGSPVERPAAERGDVWLPLLLLLSMVWLVVQRGAPNVQQALANYDPLLGASRARVWISGSVLAMGLAGAVVFAAWLLRSLSRRPAWQEWCRGLALFFATVALVALVSTAAGNGVYYHFYAPGGWPSLWANRPAVMVMGLLAAATGLLALWWLGPAVGLWLAALADGALLAGGPVAAARLWGGRGALADEVLIAAAAAGVLLVFLTFMAFQLRLTVARLGLGLAAQAAAALSPGDSQRAEAWLVAFGGMRDKGWGMGVRQLAIALVNGVTLAVGIWLLLAGLSGLWL